MTTLFSNLLTGLAVYGLIGCATMKANAATMPPAPPSATAAAREGCRQLLTTIRGSLSEHDATRCDGPSDVARLAKDVNDVQTCTLGAGMLWNMNHNNKDAKPLPESTARAIRTACALLLNAAPAVTPEHTCESITNDMKNLVEGRVEATRRGFKIFDTFDVKTLNTNEDFDVLNCTATIATTNGSLPIHYGLHELNNNNYLRVTPIPSLYSNR